MYLSFSPEILQAGAMKGYLRRGTGQAGTVGGLWVKGVGVKKETIYPNAVLSPAIVLGCPS